MGGTVSRGWEWVGGGRSNEASHLLRRSPSEKLGGGVDSFKTHGGEGEGDTSRGGG